LLTFTADEAWAFGTSGTEYAEDSVHVQNWPAPPPEWTDAAIESDIAVLLRVRAQVNEAIEPLRAGGQLGKSLDAAIALGAGPAHPDFPALERHRTFLAELFIVSQVDLQPSDNQSVLNIKVQPCTELGYERCPRCWRWVPALEASSHGNVCPRCIAALNS
jgi:isoleucyl-tRNA synthetase